MKKTIIRAMILVLLCSGCAPAIVPPVPTASRMASPTFPPTMTPEPTSTSQPTATAIPDLPDTIDITFDTAISPILQEKIKSQINEAYWFYVGMGCSPDGFHAHFSKGTSGYVDYIDSSASIEIGVSGVGTDLTMSEYGAISNELVNAMCELAFAKPQPGQFGSMDLNWLGEPVAINLSAMERIADNGIDWGFRNYSDREISDLKEVAEKYCGISPAMLEAHDAFQTHADVYFPVSQAAVHFLVETSPGGYEAIWNYYKNLHQESSAKAFLDAFGRTKEDFYQQYQEECGKGFPTILVDTSTPIGQGCVNEHSTDASFTIHCLGRMAKESLPTAFQDREIVYGFEISGLDLSSPGIDLNKIVDRPHGFLIGFDSNILYLIVPPSAASGDYYVTIPLSDGRVASAIFHWQKNE
jgi:hypothetical protein